ncbi:MAG TPA: hypothetical protein VK945_06810 [Planococcus sp. (in: firmicutes)]|nr:hypothetical protein [Planococcus sp. (in: firmicutes)]
MARAELTVNNVENRPNGTYNLAANPVTMEELVKTFSFSGMKPGWFRKRRIINGNQPGKRATNTGVFRKYRLKCETIFT